MIEIIKNAGPPKRYHKYPFAQMEVGDAFDLPLSERVRVTSAYSGHIKRHGGKFAIRKLNAENIRVFRVG